MSRFLIALAPLALLTSLATAAPARPSGTTHSPPVVVDETHAFVGFRGSSSQGYTFSVTAPMTGWTSQTDSARLEIKQKGKLIAKIDCGGGVCADSSGKEMKATGPMEAELIYWDDKEEKEYLVRTFKFTVSFWKGSEKSWDRYGIVQDDSLGGAWLEHSHPDENTSSYKHPTLTFWMAHDDFVDAMALRCTVDGKKLDDIGAALNGSDQAASEIDTMTAKDKRIRYHWTRATLEVGALWGTRAAEPRDYLAKGSYVFLGDNPGQWMCGLRTKGKVVREFRFTVNKDGMVESDAMNVGTKNAIPAWNSATVFVDMRLTKDSSTLDERINPAAIKKSLQWGLPWPEHENVKAIHAALPAKSGYPDPK